MAMCMPCCRCVCHVVASLSCLFPLGLNRHPRPGAPRRWQRSRDLGLPAVTTAFKAGHINGGGLLLAGKCDTVCSRHYALDTCSNTVGEDLSDFDEDEHNALGNVDWKPEGWCREGREPAIDARVDVQECRMDELQDSDDEPELRPEEERPGSWLAAGELEIFELNRQLDLDLPEADDHHTLAGFLLERLQHIPSAGEGLHFNGLQFEITAMAGPRIERVRLVLPSSEEDSD